MFHLAAFYDEVLRELIAAMGAALFFGNAYALIRRRRDRDRIGATTVARARPGSPVRGQANPGARKELAQAPVGSHRHVPRARLPDHGGRDRVAHQLTPAGA